MHRPGLIFITLFLFLISCRNDDKIIVSDIFVDSLINHFGEPTSLKNNQDNLIFWKDRIQSNNPGITNELQYAAALITNFNLLGDINDVKKSDSVLYKIVKDYNGKEPAPLLALTKNAILQHRFQLADSLLQLAKKMDVRPYEIAAASFDVNFELGKMIFAENDLKKIKIENDYGYQFRQSKMMHYKGDLDASIKAMEKAVELANTDEKLKQLALSNLADLYIHDGKLNKAYKNYEVCVKLNAYDLHSLLGIGWIALVHDKNNSLAEKIFHFVQTKTKSPDPLFKLIQLAQQKQDTILELKYANEFVAKIEDTIYGNMYNKYLIQLYTGILKNPEKAEMIALQELNNRATPQTYAWYVWALFCNNKIDEAYKVYEKKVSEKPLEALELYWMGKLMQSLNKGYNAQQFFELADKNKYDLSPSIIKDLNKILEE